ncbi:UDP-glucoronosyl and UDP-glucosyl transferase [Dictyocaulus viviparus]|uniref:UDP-glucuronosyltransferase n=1 Tax=Dictyocaulus viviparus TaxID=29172 RepID=A0A0D8Y549_DICVI|nr:UDP-glucoronosyl and UDP-glucosyl transferase [Dictyocaulus viviparus]
MLLMNSFLFLTCVVQWCNGYKMVLFAPDIANSQVLFNTRIAEKLAKAGHDVTVVILSGDFNEKTDEVIIMNEIKEVLENKKFLNWLPMQKFDLAFSHMIDVCPIGLIHYAKIPSWIWLNSGALMDFVAYYMGVPTIPSYVPPMMMESSDQMNFVERIKSFIGHPLTLLIWKSKLQELQRIVDDALGLVVFSFGSVAPSHMMPSTWKNAFLDAFKRFPNYRFVMAYEGTDLQDRLPSNVHVFKWIPQTDLLAQTKTKAFITHGGYNSIQEAIIAGVPMITIPLFGDQPKNAKMAEKYRIAVNLRKSEVSSENIVNALGNLLNDESYSKNIRRLSTMMKKKPVNAEHLLVAWAEFVAEFRTLDNLVPAGNDLNFFVYHSLDVIAFLITSSTLVFIVLWKFIMFIFRRLCLLCRPKNPKKSKRS